MDELKAKLELLRARVDGLSLRERVLVLAAFLALLLSIWNGLIQNPIAQEDKRLRMELSQSELRIQALQVAAEEILARSRVDPNENLRQGRIRLSADLDQLRARQAQLASSFLTPQSTALLLQDMLRARSSLRLISLNSVPPEPMMAADPAMDEKLGKGEIPPMLYRHDLVLEFEGAYFDMLEYLKLLEGQALYWDSIDYHVSAYPLARVRLRVYTLSFEREWLGV